MAVLHRYVNLALLALLCLTICGTTHVFGEASTSISLPDTPVGKGLGMWLDAFNSGNRETIRAFAAVHMFAKLGKSVPADAIADRLAERSKEVGGYDVRQIIKATPDKIAVAVQAGRFGYWYELQMSVTTDASQKILGTREDAIDPPAELLPKEKLGDVEIHDRVDALVTKLIDADHFSGAILIAWDGKPVYQRAAGMANRTWNALNQIDTKFNVASIGKMFTAVATMQLVENGKLSLDDAVGKILPVYADSDLGRRVTIRHLLSHTSGLTIGDANLPDKSATLAFEPGSKFQYSNDGFNLLATIIEKVSGQAYHDYVREHVFKPAGMNDSDNYDLETDPPNLSTGYMDSPDGVRRDNIFHLPHRGIGSGLGYSTAPDMVKFQLALVHHALLNEQSLNTLWTGQIDTGRHAKYGFGCYIAQYNNTRIIWHSGGWMGITDHFDMYPDLGYTVVILNNIDSAPTPLAQTIRGWLTQGTAMTKD
jgi:D-alanyl-D-alanine carboxypeptidase